MSSSLMHLKVVLPSALLLDVSEVRQIVVETQAGAYGLLPRRLDCVAFLVPGIISYKTADDQEGFVAVDAGVIVKHDREVSITVRRAFASKDLALLHRQLSQFLQALSESEVDRRQHKQHLEAGFLRRFAEFRHA